MSYCMRCGKQTDNEDFICDECRRKDSAVSGAAGQDAPAQASDGGADAAANGRQGAEFQSAADNRPQAGWQPRAAAGQPYYNSPYGSVPNTPWAAPYVPPEPIAPADRSQLPLNKCGLIGMIFSLVAAGCLILAVSVIGFGLDAAMENIVADAKEVAPVLLILSVIAVGLVSFLPMVASWVLAALGVVFSAVAVARRKRFRGWEMGVAGIVIGGALLCVVMVAAIV